jgi:hypothetical protein
MEAYFMNAEQENAALGRLARDYADARKRLALLKNEAENVGRVLRTFGDSLTMAPMETTVSPEVEQILSDSGRIRNLLRELKQTQEKLLELNQRMKDAGLL